MSKNLHLAGAMVAAGLILTAVACGSEEQTPIRAGVPATPDVQATITALAQGVALGTPTPTAVPDSARAVALEFAAGNNSISIRWEEFHDDFDSWREGLVTCNADSVRAALRGFAGRFGGITATARALPRTSVVRALADDLIQAAEEEEEALRLLRDTWQPSPAALALVSAGGGTDEESGQDDGFNPPQAVFPFERVDTARAAAAVLRKEVADALSDRTERTTKSSLAEADTFSARFLSLDSSWEDFHREYDTFRSQFGDLTSGQTVARLGSLVDQFREIVGGVRRLPTTEATREVVQILAQVAQEEDLTLRRLRGTFQKTGETMIGTPEEELPEEGAPAEDPGLVQEGGEAAEVSPEIEVSFEAGDLSLFDAFDAQIVASNAVRLQAGQELALVLEDISKETRDLVAEFTEEYDLLLKEWNAFHRDYDEWRATEGGCDRSKAIETLSQFTVTFGEIASDVRGLPAATVLRPMGEILVEAVEREERAIRELRNAWQPYAVDVYQNLDQERGTAGKLRRQVAVGIQELLERFGISPGELE